MHPNAKKALLTKIAAVAEQASDDPDSADIGARSWGMKKGSSTTIDGAAVEQFRSIVENFASKGDWNGRFSDRFIDDRLGEVLVAEHRHDRDEAERLLDELIEELESFSTEQRVFVPVSGIVLMIPELTVGRVTFRKGLPVGVNAESEVGTYLTGRTHAEFRVIADPIKAGELGAEETRRALEALTFAHIASAPYGPFSDAVISIESERVAPAAWVGVVSSTSAYYEYRRAERAMPVGIQSGTLLNLHAHGLEELSDILVREIRDLSELEKSILWAVHWLATAQVQVELESRLLNLTTSLEALVGPLNPKTDPISGTMAEAVALIVRSRYEERKEVRRFIVDQYGARSGVSHGGKRYVAASEVRRLREIVIDLILKLLAVRVVVKDRASLFAWLERTRLGGSLASPGDTRTISELRTERGMSFMQLVHQIACLPDQLDHWERSGPDFPAMRSIATELKIPIERISPPPHHLLMNHRGHRFLLGVRRRGKAWVAQVKGYDWNDAEAKPFRPVDPKHPHALSASIIATANWDFEAHRPDAALEGLRSRIDSAMERALTPSRLPDDPEDWQPPATAADV